MRPATTLDPFDPASRRSHFEQAGSRAKAEKLLAEIDRSCRCLGIAIPCGSKGVEFVGELPSSAMLNLRWAAKLKTPPSHETFAELFRIIRERQP